MDGLLGCQRRFLSPGRVRRGLGALKVFIALGVIFVLSSTGTAAADPPLQSLHDSATGSGSTTFGVSSFALDVTSGPAGQSPSGSITVDVPTPVGTFTFTSNSISCLAVNGNSATVAGTLQSNAFSLAYFKATAVDNGPEGSGLDTLAVEGSNSPLDCSTATTGLESPVNSGDIVVTDAPPTSTSQCANGGYARFGFLNEGLCIASVQRSTVHTPSQR